MLRVNSGFLLVAAFVTVVGSAATAGASIIYTTPTGATTSGGAVDANAMFTFSSNQVVITLNNLQANPADVAQNISHLEFTISTGQTAGTIEANNGIPRTVNGDGTFTDGASGAAGWTLSTDGSQMELNNPGSKDLIIGPPGGTTYSNANGSIAGNNGHNPFMDQTITWTLDVTGVTSSSTVTAVTFDFGTSTGGEPVTGTPTVGAPEPTTLGLLMFGGIAALLRGRKNRRAAA